MKIKPLGKIIELKIEKINAGDLTVDGREAAVEYAEVIGIGDDVSGPFKIGDKVFVKAWAIDIIRYQDITYYFCNIDTGGILAKIT